MQPDRRRLFSIATALFFLSGSTGLAYEVIWFKRFAHIWGSTSLAMASVVASFLLGLGLGAYLIGRRADRVDSPLRWYAACEALIGLLAAGIPFVLHYMSAASAALYPSLSDQPAIRFLVQFALTFVTIGPVCILMGGTLPLLVREFTARDGSLTEATGWLYAVNTFGAAAGCYLTGFHVLPTWGLFWTNNFAAALNLAIGAVALWVAEFGVAAGTPTSTADGESTDTTTAPDAEPMAVATVSESTGDAAVAVLAATDTAVLVEPVADVPWRAWGVYPAALLTGASALVLQMVWARQVALVVGGTTYAFTATVFVVLAAIALGSLIYHLWLRRREELALRAYTWIVLAVALTTAAGMQLVPALCHMAGAARDWRAAQFFNALFCAGASAVIEFAPAIGMGVLFPLLVHLTHRSAREVGRTVGSVYFWNALGSILGATLTGALLIPWIGSYGAAALAIGMYLLALVVVLPLPERRTAPAWIGGAAIAVLALGAALLEPDPRQTNLGQYLYGQKAREELDRTKVLFFEEGPSANVLVLEQGAHRNLRVNGKVDASNQLDMQTQAGSAYLARLFRPDAKEVLVIGYGSGTTSGVSLLFPDTNVTCVEIEPAVYAASTLFSDVNHRPGDSDRFEAVIGDGRTFVEGADRKFDLIVSEPPNPWMAGVSALFTQDFYRAVKDRLNEGGVLVQWVQTYQFTIDEYALVVRTLRSVFPHVGMIVLSGEGLDTLLVASDRPLLPTAEDVARVQEQIDAEPAILADLDKYFGTTEIRKILVSRYLLGTLELAQIGSLAEQTVNTDLNLRLEFDAPLHIFDQNRNRHDAALPRLAAAVDSHWLERFARTLGCDPQEIDFLLDAASFALRHRQFQPAAECYETAIRRNPQAIEPRLKLGNVRLVQQRLDDAARVFADVLQIDPTNIDALRTLGEIFTMKRKYGEAVSIYRRALAIDPAADSVANNLAWVLATSQDADIRKGDEAVRLARQVCERDGYQTFQYLDTLAAAYAEVGNYDEAILMAQQALEGAIDEDSGRLARDIETRLRLYEAGQPFHEG